MNSREIDKIIDNTHRNLVDVEAAKGIRIGEDNSYTGSHSKDLNRNTVLTADQQQKSNLGKETLEMSVIYTL